RRCAAPWITRPRRAPPTPSAAWSPPSEPTAPSPWPPGRARRTAASVSSPCSPRRTAATPRAAKPPAPIRPWSPPPASRRCAGRGRTRFWSGSGDPSPPSPLSHPLPSNRERGDAEEANAEDQRFPRETRRQADFPLSRWVGGDGRGGQGVRGLRVVVTRAAHQAEGLTTAFRAAGATVEHLPLLEVIPPADPRPLERAASELALYDWLVFTSSNAVDAFLPLT